VYVTLLLYYKFADLIQSFLFFSLVYITLQYVQISKIKIQVAASYESVKLI